MNSKKIKDFGIPEFKPEACFKCNAKYFSILEGYEEDLVPLKTLKDWREEIKSCCYKHKNSHKK